MSILAALARAYERLPDAPPYGYSEEKIGFLISLNADGSVAHVIDLREGKGAKKSARTLNVPASFKRPGVTPRPFFFGIMRISHWGPPFATNLTINGLPSSRKSTLNSCQMRPIPDCGLSANF